MRERVSEFQVLNAKDPDGPTMRAVVHHRHIRLVHELPESHGGGTNITVGDHDIRLKDDFEDVMDRLTADGWTTGDYN